MPRSKGPRGKSRGGRGSYDNRSTESSFIPFAGTTVQNGFHGTLQSEALNTQRDQSPWGSDQKLRYSKVNFVSAGGFEPSKLLDPLLEPEAALAEMSLEDGSESANTQYSALKKQSPKQANFAPAVDIISEDEAYTKQCFVIDTDGAQTIATGLPSPKVRSLSPTSSDSSEEIIVFAGRDQSGRGISKDPPTKIRRFQNRFETQFKVIEDKIQIQNSLLAETVRSHATGFLASQKETNDKAPEVHPRIKNKGDVYGSQLTKIKSSRLKPTSRPGNKHYRSLKNTKKDEQSLIDDYIANMEPKELKQIKPYNLRDLGGIDSDIWQETDLSFSRSPPKKARDNEWSREELFDFGDLSTSDGMFGPIQAVLSKRERKSGLQYLVVYDGQKVDEARWIPAFNLTESTVVNLIKEFEAEERLEVERLDENDDDTDHFESDLDANLSGEEEDEDLDEADLKQRKIDRMTDEKIAKFLSKQEQRCIGTTEVMHFDDSAEDEVEINHEDMAIQTKPRSVWSQRRVIRGAKRPRGEFPAASALADAYDGFDVMDFERPSLKKKPKGRMSKLAFDLSDSDLEASTQMARDMDRMKKKERKEKREELRALGLLGAQNKKPDLKVKYKEGMGIFAVKIEIRDFLKGNNTTLALPPMDKADRKIVHEIANAFNLKSKSAGSGSKRFPVLYRTLRSSPYNERAFDAVEARLTRHFLPRMDLKGKGSGAMSNRTGRGGSSSTAVSYRDGDIVGGSAPELGVENRGRTMLEKMGWSSGTALGALNNKGILQPVTHIVKTTKAGLG